MYYLEVLEALFKNSIDYLIVGGLAVNLHGVPRSTQDIDIIISMKQSNILKLNKILKDMDYIPRLPVNPDDLANPNQLKEWIDEKNLRAFNFYNKKEIYKSIDIVILHPLDFTEVFQRKIIKKIGLIDINLISIDDLIAMKLNAGRQQDLSDVKMLKKVKKLLDDENV